MVEWIGAVFGAITTILGVRTLLRHMGGWKAMRETRAYVSLGLVIAGMALLAALAFGAVRFSLSSLVLSFVLVLGGSLGAILQLRTGRLGRFLVAYDKLQDSGHLAEDPSVPLSAVTADELADLRSRIEQLRDTWPHVEDLASESHFELHGLIVRDLARVDEALHRLESSSRT
jgi:hypothetical protein